MIILSIIVIVTVWTVAGIWYAFCYLGDKNRPGRDPWYIWVLGAPVLAIVYVIGFFTWLRRRFCG